MPPHHEATTLAHCTVDSSPIHLCNLRYTNCEHPTAPHFSVKILTISSSPGVGASFAGRFFPQHLQVNVPQFVARRCTSNSLFPCKHAFYASIMSFHY